MPVVKEQTRTDVRPRVTSEVGIRIRAARKQAGLTQQQVAGDRYTKAYISALENSLVRPSVAALEYLAGRLGTTPSALMSDARPSWTRVDVDLQLAAAKWQAAADGYQALLSDGELVDKKTRAELLRGRAEAYVRLGKVPESLADASESVELFKSLGRNEDAALANYWVSASLYEMGNSEESKQILLFTLSEIRNGMDTTPDFRLRVLMGLAAVEARDRNFSEALAYLEQIRGLMDVLDDRRRAQYLADLAYAYTETGDYEAAIRTGHSSLAMFKAAETDTEMARLEYELALAHLYNGNPTRADELVDDSIKRFSRLGDGRQLAHALDTRAQIEIARGEFAKAIDTAKETDRLAVENDNPYAVMDARLTTARALAGLATADDGAKYVEPAKAAFESAAELARSQNRPQVVRRVLTEWADFVAAQGDHKAAFELSREALTNSR